MHKEMPLSERIYFDACYADIVRTVGYAGMTYRDWNVNLQEMIQRYGRRAESAAYHLVTFEGQMRTNPPPLAKVELRAEVRRFASQLLGLWPEHPLYHFLTQGPPNLLGEDAEKWEAEYRAKLKAGEQMPTIENAPNEPPVETPPAEGEPMPAAKQPPDGAKQAATRKKALSKKKSGKK
jgi:hypothetical protein